MRGDTLDAADNEFQSAQFMLLEAGRQVGAFLDLDSAMANDADVFELAIAIKGRLDSLVGGAV